MKGSSMLVLNVLLLLVSCEGSTWLFCGYRAAESTTRLLYTPACSSLKRSRGLAGDRLDGRGERHCIGAGFLPRGSGGWGSGPCNCDSARARLPCPRFGSLFAVAGPEWLRTRSGRTQSPSGPQPRRKNTPLSSSAGSPGGAALSQPPGPYRGLASSVRSQPELPW